MFTELASHPRPIPAPSNLPGHQVATQWVVGIFQPPETTSETYILYIELVGCILFEKPCTWAILFGCPIDYTAYTAVLERLDTQTARRILARRLELGRSFAKRQLFARRRRWDLELSINDQ